MTRVGLEPPTSGSGVRGVNRQATAPPNTELKSVLESFCYMYLRFHYMLRFYFLINEKLTTENKLAMNRKLNNQNPNPALKTKRGNNLNYKSHYTKYTRIASVLNELYIHSKFIVNDESYHL